VALGSCPQEPIPEEELCIQEVYPEESCSLSRIIASSCCLCGYEESFTDTSKKLGVVTGTLNWGHVQLQGTAALEEEDPEAFGYTQNYSMGQMIKKAVPEVARYEIYLVDDSNTTGEGDCPILTVPAKPLEEDFDFCCRPNDYSIDVEVEVEGGVGATAKFWIVPITNSGWRLTGSVVEVAGGDCCADLAVRGFFELVIAGNLDEFVSDPANVAILKNTVAGMLGVDAKYVQVTLKVKRVYKVKSSLDLSLAGGEEMDEDFTSEDMVKGMKKIVGKSCGKSADEISSLTIKRKNNRLRRLGADERRLATSTYVVSFEIETDSANASSDLQAELSSLSDPTSTAFAGFSSEFLTTASDVAAARNSSALAAMVLDVSTNGVSVAVLSITEDITETVVVTYVITIPADEADLLDVTIDQLEEIMGGENSTSLLDSLLQDSGLNGTLSGFEATTTTTTTTTVRNSVSYVEEDDGLSAGAIVGIVFAVLFAVIGVAAAAGAFWYLRRQKKLTRVMPLQPIDVD